jgi:hypothetical protein
MNFTLNQVTTALNNSIEQAGGIDAAIEICDRMYSGVWRSAETISASEAAEDDRFEGETQHDIFAQAYRAANPSEEGFDFDDVDLFVECLSNDERDNLTIKTGDKFVFLCNYKGEGEGQTLERLAKHLSVFVSKDSSFNDSIKR